MSVDANVTYFEAVWTSWGYLSDPGKENIELNIAGEGGLAAGIETNENNLTVASYRLWYQRFVAFITTCMGILFTATIVAFIVDGVRAKLDDLKKGKSTVIETNHVVMIGWSDKVGCV